MIRAVAKLLLECRPFKPCDLGYYIMSSDSIILRESYSTDALILYLIGTGTYGTVTVVSFKVKNDVGDDVDVEGAWFPQDILWCSSPICIDGRAVAKGEYSKYKYTRFALVVNSDDKYIVGNLFLIGRYKYKYNRGVINWRRLIPGFLTGTWLRKRS